MPWCRLQQEAEAAVDSRSLATAQFAEIRRDLQEQQRANDEFLVGWRGLPQGGGFDEFMVGGRWVGAL